MSRADTAFNLRYAVRVLERQHRYWRNLDALVRLTALLAGSAAIATLAAALPGLALLSGIVFAAMQAVEYGLAPAQRAAEALAARQPYADVLAGAAGLDDAALEAALQRVIAADTLVVGKALRLAAYNDVVDEQGLDPAALYRLNARHRLVAWLS